MDNGVDGPHEGLSVGLLGPLVVGVGSREVPVAGPKRRALLARLSIDAGRAVSTDRLIEDLWAPSPPRGARATLQSHVSHLRRDMGDHGSALRHGPAGYVLDLGPDAVDAVRFERLARAAMAVSDPAAAADGLRTALALWRGRAHTEFADQAWARDHAARLDELRMLATTARIDADFWLGRHAALVGELEAVE